MAWAKIYISKRWVFLSSYVSNFICLAYIIYIYIYIFRLQNINLEMKHFIRNNFSFSINAYEKDDHIIIDIACYRNCSMLYLMSVDKLASAQSNKEYSKKFQGRPHRFVIPLNFESLSEQASSHLNPRKTLSELTSSSDNLITLETSTFGACAQLVSPYKINLTPGKICNVGVETPTINYDAFNGRPYRYFYGVCADVDAPDCSGKINKVT